jgi:hypothetical protein
LCRCMMVICVDQPCLRRTTRRSWWLGKFIIKCSFVFNFNWLNSRPAFKNSRERDAAKHRAHIEAAKAEAIRKKAEKRKQKELEKEVENGSNRDGAAEWFKYFHYHLIFSLFNFLHYYILFHLLF